jgi:hypothetical protein
MPAFILKDGKFILNGYDLSGFVRSMDLSLSTAEIDVTTIDQDSIKKIGGLEDLSISAEGFFEAGVDKPDELFGSNLGSNVNFAVAADNGKGNFAYFGGGLETNYSIFGAVGEAAPFQFTGSGTETKHVKGTIEDPGTTAITANGNTTGFELGAVTSSQKLYAAIFVFTPSGTSPTLDVKVQSDDNSSFTSATDRITFTQATGRTSEIKTADGAITDTHYRFNYTVGGSTPSFTIFGIIGKR